MAESNINSVFRREHSNFFLNTGRVFGIQSLSINNNFGANPLLFLGQGNRHNPLIPSIQNATVSINSLLINQDFFYPFVTGNNLVNAYILPNKGSLDGNYCLISGYLNNFRCSYQSNQIPFVSTDIIFLDNAGYMTTGELRTPDFNQLQTLQTGVYSDNNPLIPFSNSVSLTFDTLINTNRVQSFDISVTPTKIPIYQMGQRKISRVETIAKTPININLVFEVGNYTAKQFFTFPRGQNLNSLTLNINSYDNNINICSYSFDNLTQISESREASTDENIIISTQYQGFIN